MTVLASVFPVSFSRMTPGCSGIPPCHMNRHNPFDAPLIFKEIRCQHAKTA